MKDINRILSTNNLFLVRVQEKGQNRLYVELNQDRAVQYEPEEVLVRVFYNLFDAERYRETVESYQLLPVGATKVVAFPGLKEVFEELSELDEKARVVFGAPIRIDLCEMPYGEHPKTIETLFSAFAERH